MSRNTLIIVGLCIAIASVGGLWFYPAADRVPSEITGATRQSPEDRSDLLFTDSMEDKLEDDVELTIEDELDKDSEIRFENDPGDNE